MDPSQQQPGVTMICESCNKFPASVRVTDLIHSTEAASAGAGGEPGYQERLLCEMCAQAMQLPKTAATKSPLNIFQMLHSARRTRRRTLPTCAECGLDLDEFKRRGRLGCPACYQAFRPQVGELLERVHGSRSHLGRVPGVTDEELERLQALVDLRQKLEVAVREEDYETAARLRDEIHSLETQASPSESA